MKSKLYKIIRLSTLGFVLIGTVVFGLLHQKFNTVSIDSICVFGGFETMFSYLKNSTFVQRTRINNIVLVFAVLISTLIFARAFCGNICPLGAVQELFTIIRSKVFKRRRFTLPVKIDSALRYLKYVVLLVSIAGAIITGDMIIRNFDPWVAINHFTSEDLFITFIPALIILGITIIGSFLYDRFFCKYLCPLGALLAILSKLSFYRINRNANTCTNCKICTRVCPANIIVHEKENIASAECINCNECVSACPVKNTLTIKNRIKKPISLGAFLMLTILIFAIPIFAASVTNNFDWTMNLQSGSGGGGSNTGGAGDGSGRGAEDSLGNNYNKNFDVDSIRGRHTFEEVSLATGIPKENFMKEFSLDEARFKQSIRDANIEASLVRSFVTSHLIENNVD